MAAERLLTLENLPPEIPVKRDIFSFICQTDETATQDHQRAEDQFIILYNEKMSVITIIKLLTILVYDWNSFKN